MPGLLEIGVDLMDLREVILESLWYPVFGSAEGIADSIESGLQRIKLTSLVDYEEDGLPHWLPLEELAGKRREW